MAGQLVRRLTRIGFLKVAQLRVFRCYRQITRQDTQMEEARSEQRAFRQVRDRYAAPGRYTIFLLLFVTFAAVQLRWIQPPTFLSSHTRTLSARHTSDLPIDDPDYMTLPPGDEQFNVIKHPAFQWNDNVSIPVTERKFVSSEEGRVFILGVVGRNSTPTAAWDRFAVYGQWYYYNQLVDANIRCCYKYPDGSTAEQAPADYQVRLYDPVMHRAKLLLWHVTCDRPGPHQPVAVSIARHSNCTSPHVTFLEPHYVIKRREGNLVITTKMAYKDVDPEYVVSFMESMRYYGVDKIITYVYHNLEPKIKRILRYYAYTGLLDYYTIELADEAKTPRTFPPLSPQYMSDEWLIKRDALERSMGSTYFGIYDMDEFLIPSRNRTYKALLRDLRYMYPKASHFFFQNIHYLTDARLPDSSCSPHCSIFKRHVMTAAHRSNYIHEKMLLMTSRVSPQTINNHHVTPVPGYHRESCPNTEAILRHYGECERKFQKICNYGNVCGLPKTWVADTWMIPWSERTVGNIIRKTLKFLNVFQ